MSVSLPRLRANSQSSKSQIHKQFKKIITETPEQIKGMLKNLRTQRLQSLERFSNIDSKRQIKNSKIHLNILQRKLLSGRYNEEVETVQDLNQLKHKKDQYKVEIEVMKKQMQNLIAQIQTMKKESIALEQTKQHKNQFIANLQSKYKTCQDKVVAITEYKAVFQHMILIRKKLNQQVIKQRTHFQNQQQKLFIQKAHLQNELREQTDKQFCLQTNLQQLKNIFQFQQKQRVQKLNNYNRQIQTRALNQACMKQKSQIYTQQLMKSERKQEQNNFKIIYNKILCHKLAQKHLTLLQLSVDAKYKNLEHDYNLISEYKTFDISKPISLTGRFFQLTPQNQKVKKNIIQQEQKIDQLTLIRSQLQTKFDAIKYRGQQQITLYDQKDHFAVQNRKIQEQTKLYYEKISLIKHTLFRLLKQFMIKGEKSSKMAPVNNTLLLQKSVIQCLSQDQ